MQKKEETRRGKDREERLHFNNSRTQRGITASPFTKIILREKFLMQGLDYIFSPRYNKYNGCVISFFSLIKEKREKRERDILIFLWSNCIILEIMSLLSKRTKTVTHIAVIIHLPLTSIMNN